MAAFVPTSCPLCFERSLARQYLERYRCSACGYEFAAPTVANKAQWWQRATTEAKAWQTKVLKHRRLAADEALFGELSPSGLPREQPPKDHEEHYERPNAMGIVVARLSNIGPVRVGADLIARWEAGELGDAARPIRFHRVKTDPLCISSAHLLPLLQTPRHHSLTAPPLPEPASSADLAHLPQAGAQLRFGPALTGDRVSGPLASAGISGDLAQMDPPAVQPCVARRLLAPERLQVFLTDSPPSPAVGPDVCVLPVPGRGRSLRIGMRVRMVLPVLTSPWLPRVRIVGARFGPTRRIASEVAQQPHTKQTVPEPGRRLASTRDRTSIAGQDAFVWDTIRAILQPPLPLELPHRVDLPHSLYPFQRDGIRFLASLRPGGVLGDDMGLGKTAQAIVALRMLVQAGMAQRAIVLCPKSVLRNWERELSSWAPLLRVATAYGNAEKRLTSWSLPAHVYLTTYDTMREDIEAVLTRTKLQFGGVFDLLIIDEVHNLKNERTKRYAAVQRLVADRRWGLSGTPLENRLDDVLRIYDLLNPSLFSDSLYYTTDQVISRIQPCFLRRRKEDVLDDLPAKVSSDIWLDLSPAQQKAYDTAERDGVARLREAGEAVTLHHVLALIQALKMICNFDATRKHSTKMEWLLDNMDEMLSEDGALLVFSHFVMDCGVDDICSSLRAYAPESYTGAMGTRQRDEAIRRFGADAGKRVMVLGTRAGGVGINLQQANYVVHFDHWWNPQTARQAEDRAHRIGQKRTVFVYHLWTRDTIEERIWGILERKRRLYERVIDGLAVVPEDELALTEEELFGLFGLTPARTPGTRIQDSGP